jgi:hypothetical protein
MKIVFVNWTKPYQYRKEFEGYNANKTVLFNSDEYTIVDYELLIHVAAVLNAKRFGDNTIKLYTDTTGYNFYKKENLLSLFDEIDINTLDEFNESHNFNAGKFWTTGKSIAIAKEQGPFIFIDMDFIIKNEIPKWIYDYDLVHTHWEIQRGDFFVSRGMLLEMDIDIPLQMFYQNMLMPNTSFLYINNPELQSLYLNLHNRIINKDYNKIPEWLWLMADQGIMGYASRYLNLKVESLEDEYYIAYHELPSDKEKLGYQPMWLKNPNYNNMHKEQKLWYEHVWIAKQVIKDNLDFRREKCTSYIDILKENNSDLVDKFIHLTNG